MTDHSIPPSHRGSSRSSRSFNSMSAQLGAFTINQLIALHAFHAEMQGAGVCSDIEFAYRHNHARVTYKLTAPMSEDRSIEISMTELRQAPGNFSYSVKCEVDGVCYSEMDVAKNVTGRDRIPFNATEVLRLQMKDFNRKLSFKEPDFPIDPKVSGYFDQWKPK